MKTDDGPLAWAAIDCLCCLLLVVYVLIAPVAKKKADPTVATPGLIAVAIEWPSGDDDVDLYVRDPLGNIVWFGATSGGLMHLEHDDLGLYNDQVASRTVTRNGERVVLRGVTPGEYVANAHMYRKGTRGETPVRAELWRLMGDDTLVKEATVMLRDYGDQGTEFRFTVDARGRVTETNRLSYVMPKQ